MKIINATTTVFDTFPFREQPGLISWGPLVVGSFKSTLVLTSPSREQYRRIYKWCVSKMGREFDKYGQPNEHWNVSLTIHNTSTLIYDSKGKNSYIGERSQGAFHYGTIRFNIESHYAVELKLMEELQ